MKVFISKWALTRGIIEADGKITTGRSGTRYFTQTGPRFSKPLLIVGKDAHETREGATEKAKFLLERKLASLRRQIAKIEALDFSKEAGK